MNDFDGFYLSMAMLPVGLGAALFFLHKNKNQLHSAKKSIFLTAWNILFILGLMFLVLFVGETYYRFFVDTTDSFGLNKITRRWGERHYKYNNLRARDNIDYGYKISPGKRRITFIGDSFTAGHGIAEVEDRFANLVRAGNPAWEVHVMAANGMETIDELQLIQKLDAEGYEFEVLVLVYVLNDISYLVPETQTIYRKIFSFDSTLGFWGRNSYFVNTLLFRWFASQNPDIAGYYGFVREAYLSDMWGRQKAALRQLDEYRKQKDWRFLTVTFPFLHNLGDENEFGEIYQQLDAFWQSISVPHLDLARDFAQHKNETLVVNAFDAHPNELANRIAALAITRFLEENIR